MGEEIKTTCPICGQGAGQPLVLLKNLHHTQVLYTIDCQPLCSCKWCGAIFVGTNDINEKLKTMIKIDAN